MLRGKTILANALKSESSFISNLFVE